MGEVAASVALVEQGAAPATPAPKGMNFADNEASADPAAAILDEVLGDPAPAPAPETEKPAEPAKPAETPAVAEPPKPDAPPSDIEAAKLRKGFAKLADDRQKLIELQNRARAEIAGAQQYATKAQKHDEIVLAIEKDPAGFLLAHGGEKLVQQALQGFIDMEKSPAEREVAKLRQEQTERDRASAQRTAEETAANWRNGIVAKVQADERFDLVNSLGLHGEVIGVITGYYEKHSERDAKGNVTKPAILPWDTAAQAVEENRAAMLDKSKRYGKRTPAAATEETPPKKDAPSAKPAAAPAKKAPTSLSSVPVAETPQHEEDLPTDDLDERQRRVLAELGI